jgi:tRNA dimethylallyltransferase
LTAPTVARVMLPSRIRQHSDAAGAKQMEASTQHSTLNAAPLLIAVMGETSSGKSALAEEIAAEIGAQLVNADTFQSYRGMDIGTAKPESKKQYALLDIKDPDEAFGVGEWVQLATTILTNIYERNQPAVVVGGSGLNVRALFEGYDSMAGAPDPELRESLNRRFKEEGLQPLVDELLTLKPNSADAVDLKNPIRVTRALERELSPKHTIQFQLPPFRKVKFAIQHPVETIRKRILDRTWQMVDNGWREEVATLRDAGYGPNAPGFRAHGYRELWRVLEGQLGLEEAVESIVLQVRRYAKRQRTWLKTEPGLKVLISENERTLHQRALDHLFVMGEGAGENGQDH